MRITIQRLRLGILVFAGLLVASIVLLLVYARWEVRRIRRDLPAKLGISIQQSTNGYTFSKSNGSHTLFTVHAAKMLQYKNGGHAELHGVSITLFNPDGSQADRIYGDDFDYDPQNGLVRANGPVQIDLQGLASTGSAPASGAGNDKNVVHVKTADLVFNQKTGQASTTQSIEFRVPQAAGTATGASLDSHTGVLILQSDVDLVSSLDGGPLVVRAHHAQFDRASGQLYLLESTTQYEESQSSSDRATVYFRPDGSADRIDANGHVIMSNEAQKVTSQSARVDLDQKSEPQRAVLEGGVHYTADDAVRHLTGVADAGTLTFGSRAMVRHAQFRKAVSIVDTEKSPPGSPQRSKQQTGKQTKVIQSTTRDAEAEQIDVDFASSPARQPAAKQILATGGAKLNIRTLYANTPPEQTAVQGDRLLVTLRDGSALESIRGTGHTKLTLISSNGVKETSTGDNLWMTFAAPPPDGPVQGRQPAAPEQAPQLKSSEQQGNVVLIQEHPPQPTAMPSHGTQGRGTSGQSSGAPTVTTATAQRATYDAATQLVKLFGNPRIRNSTGDLTAAAIELDQSTGNATAAGGVKATYQTSTSTGPSTANFGGPEPVHVIADHAYLDQGKGLSIFYGQGLEDARLWQGADSISAMVLELSRSQQTLSAHGASGTDAKAVKAVLASVGNTAAGKDTQPRKPGQTSVVRLTSQTLLYSENKAIFSGRVVAEDSSGTMRANVMDVYFSQASPSQPAGAPVAAGKAKPQEAKQGGELQGEKQGAKQVERIIARGGVELEQPGRKGTGNQLVYTAQDGNFSLTGSDSAPPRVVDQAHGTLTGGLLIFNDRDDSVMVNGGNSQAVTDTRTAK